MLRCFDLQHRAIVHAVQYCSHASLFVVGLNCTVNCTSVTSLFLTLFLRELHHTTPHHTDTYELARLGESKQVSVARQHLSWMLGKTGHGRLVRYKYGVEESGSSSSSGGGGGGSSDNSNGGSSNMHGGSPSGERSRGNTSGSNPVRTTLSSLHDDQHNRYSCGPGYYHKHVHVMRDLNAAGSLEDLLTVAARCLPR